MAVVVSDTSPLRALALLGRLDLLQLLFAEVLIPPAVDAEARKRGHHSNAIEISDSDCGNPRFCLENGDQRSPEGLNLMAFGTSLIIDHVEAITLRAGLIQRAHE